MLNVSRENALWLFFQSKNAQDMRKRCRYLTDVQCRLIMKRRPYMQFSDVLRVIEQEPALGVRMLYDVIRAVFG